MRLVPRSLFSRLVMVLLGGLLVAQFASFAIHMRAQSEALTQASGLQAAQRIADIVKLLEPLAPFERRRIAQVFSAPPLAISLDTPQMTTQEVGAATSARSARFAAMLQRFLGDGRAGAVAVIQTQTTATTRTMGHGAMGSAPHGAWMSPGAAMHFGAQAGFSYVVQVRLDDGSLITFDSRLPAQIVNWPYRLLLSLAILLGAVLIVSLVAVRWATRPLNALADAADELGHNIDRPPMLEEGPTEVVRAARAFNTMQKNLNQYLRERTATLAAMSHDLKTPVTRLRLRAELLEDGELKEKISQDLQEMESMVQATLEFMRGGESAEKIQPIDVMALLDSLEGDARDVGAQVAIEGSVTRPYFGRPQALKRCLGNLIDNALKYGRQATILVEDDAQRLVLRILDTGPGIPEAQLERVFEPFYRIEVSRSRDTGGTGLGLAIARNIAQLHRGTLTLHNMKAGGLEAVLTLPRG